MTHAGSSWAAAPDKVRYMVNRHSSDGHGTESRTTLHRADCTWAVRYGDSPKWLGPFHTYVEAATAAGTTGYPVSSCGQCRPWLRRRGDA